jgi:hypothetical protein
MIVGARSVPRGEQEWVFVSFDQGSILDGPGIQRDDVPAGDVHALEHEGMIRVVRTSPDQGNPTYVITKDGRDYHREMLDKEPAGRQEGEFRRFLDSEAFKADYPEAYSKWAEADELLWRADSEREFTTVGHKVREALQAFATEAVTRYRPPDVATDPARVNKRLGAVIAQLAPSLGEHPAEMLRALGDYSEAVVAVVQRQEHGAQKEGEELSWQDARRVVFHAGSVMFEFAQSFRDAAS